MNDILGNVINDGDYLIQDAQETAYFWQCQEGQPVLIARWGIGMLERYDIEEIRRTQKNFQNPELKVPQSVKEGWDVFTKNMESKQFQDLELIESNSFLIKAMNLLEILPEGYFAAEPVLDEHSNMVAINIELYSTQNLSEV